MQDDRFPICYFNAHFAHSQIISLTGLSPAKHNLTEFKMQSAYLLWIVRVHVCLVTKLCLTFCDAMDCSMRGFSVHRISQARILERVAFFFSRGPSGPRDQTQVSWLAGGFFTHWTTRDRPSSSVGKESAINAGDLGLIPGPGRSPGEGNGNPLQWSCLGNPMHREAYWATVRGVARVRHYLVTKSPPPLESQDTCSQRANLQGPLTSNLSLPSPLEFW